MSYRDLIGFSKYQVTHLNKIQQAPGNQEVQWTQSNINQKKKENQNIYN